MSISLPRLLAWCAPALPIAALGLPLVVHLPPYYAGTLGLPLATAGMLFALVRIVDIPIDPLLGAMMDRTRSRFGPIRPWMAGGAILLAIGVWFLFMARPGVGAVQTFFVLLAVYIGFSAVQLAQMLWGSRLSGNYGERARIFGWWTATYQLGSLAVLFLPPLAARLDPAAGPAAGIHAIGWFLLALLLLTIPLALLCVPDGEEPAATHHLHWRDLSAIFADRRLGRLLLTDLLLSAAPGMTGALFLFLFTAARGFPAATASALLLPYFIAGLASAPLWVRFARRFGKHRATALAGVLLGATLLPLLVVPPDALWLSVLAMAAAGIPFAAPVFLMRSMMADLNDAQRLEGNDHSALNYALLTATQKLGYALPVGLTYPLLSLVGFQPALGPNNSQHALLGLETLFIGPPLLIALAGAATIWRWPIGADEHARIRAALDGEG